MILKLRAFGNCLRATEQTKDRWQNNMSEGNTFLTSCLFESELAFFCRVQVTAVVQR